MDSTRPAVRALTDRVDRRLPGGIGRHARLELVFGCRGGRTVLTHAYAEPPFRVGRCFAEDGGGVHLILASSAPGVFGGDCFEQSIRVERGARVRLTSQSALQVHPSSDSSAGVLHASYEVDADAHLHCHWHPIIPFAGARLAQRIAVGVAVGGSLSWSDALMCGRQGRGEHWLFEDLAHELRLSIGGSLRYLERYRLSPRERHPQSRWITGGATYFGTILACGSERHPCDIEALHAELSSVADVRAAASLVEPNVLVVRLAAMAGTPFHHARLVAAARLAHAQRVGAPRV